MAHIPISFGGQVGDLDKITAEASDVVKPKIIVDKDGNALSGTLDDYSGTAKQAAIGLDHGNSRLQMRIPASGKYGTTSTLYTAYPDVRNAIGLSGDKLWPGASVLGTGSSRSSMNGQTVTPSASRQTIACNGKAMNGDIIVNGDANLTGGNIVKGRTIFGVT